MTYRSSIPGTRVVGDRTGVTRENVRIPCARCGILRVSRPTSPLCGSCRAVLTPTERKAWTA